jgi:hypothetical protein
MFLFEPKTSSQQLDLRTEDYANIIRSISDETIKIS